MKNVKYKLQLPIKPTQKPDGEEISAVAMAALDIAQHSLLSPAAVVSSLRCALEVYERNIEAKGFDPVIIEKCEALGVEMARVLLETRANPQIVGSDGRKVPTGLVDATGNTVVIEEPEDEEPSVEQANEGHPMPELSDDTAAAILAKNQHLLIRTPDPKPGEGDKK